MSVLRGLLETRVMTAAHAAALYFEGRLHAAKKRLGKLKAAKLIGERPRRTFEPAIMCQRIEGIRVLEQRGILDEYPQLSRAALERRARVSPLTLKHELAVMDIKAALCVAVNKSSSADIERFATWPAMNQFEVDGVVVKPDGFFVVREKRWNGHVAHNFFLELDRSTESQAVLVARASRYHAHYRSGRFAERQAGSGAAKRDHAFRVLYVLQTRARRDNTAALLVRQNPPILTHVWLTTEDELKADPLGAIWIRPVDYRDASAGGSEHRVFQRRASERRRAAREPAKLRLF